MIGIINVKPCYIKPKTSTVNYHKSQCVAEVKNQPETRIQADDEKATWRYNRHANLAPIPVRNQPTAGNVGMNRSAGARNHGPSQRNEISRNDIKNA